MNDPALIARWEPHRRARRPSQCRDGEPDFAGPCWVRDPYGSLKAGHHYGVTCTSCGGSPASYASYSAPSAEQIDLYGKAGS